jgi:BolA protein
MTLIEEITTRLQVLKPITLDIEDESALHAGHKGNGGGGHFKLTISSEKFNELTQLARHRMIYDLVNDLIPTRVHALSIQANGSQ